MQTPITVLKFGSSVLRSEADLPRAVHEIYRYWRQGSRVLAVVSALGNTTDALIQLAETIHAGSESGSFATLLATGEAASAALMGLSLERAGIPSRILSPEQLGLRTAGDKLDAEPIEVNLERLNRELASSVAIVSGFIGLDNCNDLTLLGRGGSDFTALFLAEQLNAECVLLKDVAGLYDSDPAERFAQPSLFARANWQSAIDLGQKIVQSKAVRFAQKHNKSFSIAAIGAKDKTEICGRADKFSQFETRKKPLRVILLGCGTVGAGVYQRLVSMPEFFEVVGVADRHPKKGSAAGIPPHLFSTNVNYLLEIDCDVVVELFGKVKPTLPLIENALFLGRNVITANKALLSDEVDYLEKIAERNGVAIRYSAAVGGVMPALEAVSQQNLSGRLKSFSGIVNGTCNFVCDRLLAGSDFDQAVREAQENGFAEAEAELDLNGTDAAQKLSLLIRYAFGASMPFDAVEREGIINLDPRRVQLEYKDGRVVRLIAECRITRGEIYASVKPVYFPIDHPFAQTKGAENCLRLETEDGDVRFIRGRGAGRWATTEAVIADLLDLHREFAQPAIKLKAAAVAQRFSLAEVHV